MEKKTVIIAFCGKGGVGKTSISALTIRLLKEKYPDKKILAIYADPAIGLSTSLGVEAASTVDDIRKLFIKHVEDGDQKATIEMLGEAKYQIFDALVEINNISFLAIGRPESAGCYCKVNAYLKEVINLISKNYDFVVIDGEAGIEQINRRVMEKVTHLILVSDASKKGLEVTKTIEKVARELVMFEKVGLIINRVTSMDIVEHLNLGDLNLLGVIPDDRNMTLSDVRGDSIFMLDEKSQFVQETKKALKKLEIL